MESMYSTVLKSDFTVVLVTEYHSICYGKTLWMEEKNNWGQNIFGEFFLRIHAKNSVNNKNCNNVKFK